MLKTTIAGQHLCSLQVFCSLSTFTCNKMYSRFVFGTFDSKKLNKRQRHPAVHLRMYLMELTSTMFFGIRKRGFIKRNLKQRSRKAWPIWLLWSHNPRLIHFTLPLPTQVTAMNLLLETSQVLLYSTSLQLMQTLKNLLGNIPSHTTVHTSTIPANFYI